MNKSFKNERDIVVRAMKNKPWFKGCGIGIKGLILNIDNGTSIQAQAILKTLNLNVPIKIRVIGQIVAK